MGGKPGGSETSSRNIGGQLIAPFGAPVTEWSLWMWALVLLAMLGMGFLIGGLVSMFTVNQVSDGSWNGEGADGSGAGHQQQSLVAKENLENLEKIFSEVNASRGSSRAAIENYRSYHNTWNGSVVSKCSRGLEGGCDPTEDWIFNICQDGYGLDAVTCESQIFNDFRFVSVTTPSVWENSIVIVEVRSPAHVLFLDAKTGALLFSHMLDENPESALLQAGTVDHQNFYLGTATEEEDPDSRYPCLRTPMFCELNVETQMVGWCRSLENTNDLLEYSTPFVPITGFDLMTWTTDCNIPRQFCSTVPLDDRLCTLGVEVSAPVVHKNDVIYFATTSHENYGTNLSDCLSQNDDFESRSLCYYEWISPYTASDCILGLSRNDLGAMVYNLAARDVDVWQWSCERYLFLNAAQLAALSALEGPFVTRDSEGLINTVDDDICTQFGRTLNASVVPCEGVADVYQCMKSTMYLHNCPGNFSYFLSNWERSGVPLGTPSRISAGPMMMPDRSLVFAAGGSVFDVDAGTFNAEEEQDGRSSWYARYKWDQKIAYSNEVSGVSRTNKEDVVVTVSFQEDAGEDDCLPLFEPVAAYAPLCGGWRLERPYRSDLDVPNAENFPYWEFPGPMSGFLNGGALTWRYGTPYNLPSKGTISGRDYVSSISTKCGGVVTLDLKGMPVTSWIGRDCADLDCLANATNRLLPLTPQELHETLLNNERKPTQVPYPTYPNCRILQEGAGMSRPAANTNDIYVVASTNERGPCVCGQPPVMAEDDTLCNSNITADNYLSSLPEGMIYINDPRDGVTLAEYANYAPFSTYNGVTLFNGCIHPVAGGAGTNPLEYVNVTIMRLCLPVSD
jgi:hypothetical protein